MSRAAAGGAADTLVLLQGQTETALAAFGMVSLTGHGCFVALCVLLQALLQFAKRVVLHTIHMVKLVLAHCKSTKLHWHKFGQQNATFYPTSMLLCVNIAATATILPMRGELVSSGKSHTTAGT